MKATQMLMVDHEEVMTMLDALVFSELIGDEAAGCGDMKASDVRLFENLKDAIRVHGRIEEQIFYPALESFNQISNLISKSYEEHGEVDDLLKRMNPGDSGWDDEIVELRRKVQHHTEKEEREVFPLAETLLGNEKLLQLGKMIQEWKSGKHSAAA